MTSLPDIEATARCLFPPEQSLPAREWIGREPVQYREMPLAPACTMHAQGDPSSPARPAVDISDCRPMQAARPLRSKADVSQQDIPWDSFDADTLQRIFRALAELDR